MFSHVWSLCTVLCYVAISSLININAIREVLPINVLWAVMSQRVHFLSSSSCSLSFKQCQACAQHSGPCSHPLLCVLPTTDSFGAVEKAHNWSREIVLIFIIISDLFYKGSGRTVLFLFLSVVFTFFRGPQKASGDITHFSANAGEQ